MLLRLLATALLAFPTSARTLMVGEGGLPTLAAAVAEAKDGDTIRLGTGSFFECAVLHQNNLVIEGAGPSTLLTDTTCQGKAILVAAGNGLTVRDLVLARARVPDGNGAGIRLEGQGLLLERVRFENDQVGVLAGAAGGGHIRIVDCAFQDGGVAGDRPSMAVMVGDAGLLQVERSSFRSVKGGQIATSAGRTELTGNHIETGAEAGAGPAVLVSRGTLLMQDNVIAVGPAPPPRDVAVVAMGEGATLRGNRLENSTGRTQILMLDWMTASPVLAGNIIGPGDAAVSSSGVWRYRAGGVARDAIGGARGLAGAVKRKLMGAFGQ